MRGLIVRVPRRLWLGLFAIGGVVGALIVGGLAYWWVIFGRQIDDRLHGERDRVLPPARWSCIAASRWGRTSSSTG